MLGIRIEQSVFGCVNGFGCYELSDVPLLFSFFLFFLLGSLLISNFFIFFYIFSILLFYIKNENEVKCFTFVPWISCQLPVSLVFNFSFQIGKVLIFNNEKEYSIKFILECKKWSNLIDEFLTFYYKTSTRAKCRSWRHPLSWSPKF